MVRMTREKQKENCLHKSSTKSLKAFRVIRRLRFRGISGHLVIWFSKISIFNLFSFPRVLKFIWKCSSKLSKQVPFYSAWWIEGSWEIWNPLVSKYDICLIIEKDFFVYLEISHNLYSLVQKIWLANSKERQYYRYLGEFLYETKLQGKLHRVAASSNFYRTKIVETPFGMKSWFHTASSNNWETLFTRYLVSI